jgi:hypothetical protein
MLAIWADQGSGLSRALRPGTSTVARISGFGPVLSGSSARLAADMAEEVE